MSANGFRALFQGLINSIQDFGIDKTLNKYGVRDQIARLDLKRPKNTRSSLYSSTDKTDRIKLRLQTIFNLPLDISHYTFGDVSDADKKEIHELAESFIGAKNWRRCVDLISNRSFGDVKGYKQMVTTYMHEFLGVTASFKKRLRSDFGELPDFWGAETYEALFLD